MATRDGDGEKPFACPVPGCKKRYKNVNGIKYHARHGHRKEQRYVPMQYTLAMPVASLTKGMIKLQNRV